MIIFYGLGRNLLAMFQRLGMRDHTVSKAVLTLSSVQTPPHQATASEAP